MNCERMEKKHESLALLPSIVDICSPASFTLSCVRLCARIIYIDKNKTSSKIVSSRG